MWSLSISIVSSSVVSVAKEAAEGIDSREGLFRLLSTWDVGSK